MNAYSDIHTKYFTKEVFFILIHNTILPHIVFRVKHFLEIYTKYCFLLPLMPLFLYDVLQN